MLPEAPLSPRAGARLPEGLPHFCPWAHRGIRGSDLGLRLRGEFQLAVAVHGETYIIYIYIDVHIHMFSYACKYTTQLVILFHVFVCLFICSIVVLS